MRGTRTASRADPFIDSDLINLDGKAAHGEPFPTLVEHVVEVAGKFVLVAFDLDSPS